VGRLHEVEWGPKQTCKGGYHVPWAPARGARVRVWGRGGRAAAERGQRCQRDTEEGRRRIVPRRRQARRQAEEGVAPAGRSAEAGRSARRGKQFEPARCCPSGRGGVPCPFGSPRLVSSPLVVRSDPIAVVLAVAWGSARLDAEFSFCFRYFH
jgi:hypothetical protein